MVTTAELAGIEFVVDDREKAHTKDDGFETFRFMMGELGAKTGRLPHHDVIVGPFGVERKEARDFISSVFDGRLLEQQAASSESGKRRILVVEGDIYRAMAFSRSGAMTPNLFYAALAALSALGVTVVYTPDVSGTRAYVEALLKRAINPITEIEESVVKIKKVSTYEAMLRQVPGLGPAKATKIVDQWPSLSLLTEVPFGDLVRLLKPATSNALWEALHGKGAKKPRVYAILGDAKAAEVTEKFHQLELDEPADWDQVKDAFSAKVANTLWEKGLAERKGQARL